MTTEITSHKIFVIEWLNSQDRKTGKELFEDVLRYKTSKTIPMSCDYRTAKSKEEFITILQNINCDLKEREIVTLDIETHGSK